MNCWVRPAAIDAFTGVTLIDVRAGAVTVRAADPLIRPTDAEMDVLPAAIVVASPVALIDATAVFEEAQVTEAVRFWVEASV